MVKFFSIDDILAFDFSLPFTTQDLSHVEVTGKINRDEGRKLIAMITDSEIEE